MQDPQEYVDFLEQFIESGHRGVKVDATREDWICLRMAAHFMEVPVEVRQKKGEVFLVRRDK